MTSYANSHKLEGVLIRTNALENGLSLSTKLEACQPPESAVFLLGSAHRNVCRGALKDSDRDLHRCCITHNSPELETIQKCWKKQMVKLWCSHRQRYYTGLKMNELSRSRWFQIKHNLWALLVLFKWLCFLRRTFPAAFITFMVIRCWDLACMVLSMWNATFLLFHIIPSLIFVSEVILWTLSDPL